MDRIKIIQKFIDSKNFKNYLEIGTYKGYSFLPIRCKNKIAVDPRFRVSRKEKLKWTFKNSSNIRNRYFEMNSDEFFRNNTSFLNNHKPDIVLVDGLHTFEASLKDVLNSLCYLNKEGVIIMHDCYPPHKAASVYATSSAEAKKEGIDGWTGHWCGDVWKTIVYLRERYKGKLEVFVLNTDMGLGIVRIKSTENIDLELDKKLFEQVNKISYEEMMSKPEEFIGLKDSGLLKY